MYLEFTEDLNPLEFVQLCIAVDFQRNRLFADLVLRLRRGETTTMNQDVRRVGIEDSLGGV